MTEPADPGGAGAPTRNDRTRTGTARRYGDIVGDGGSGIAAQVAEQQDRARARLATVGATVAIVSGKGGVGKSSITANLAAALAMGGWRVGVLDADLNGPSMAKMLGVRGRTLVVGPAGVEPPVTALGVKVMSMDLLLETDDAPLQWRASTQREAHTWRGAMEASALREFLTDTSWGDLDALLLDLPPGTDRLATLGSLVPRLTGIVVVTIASEVAQLVVGRSITAANATGAPVLGLVENMAGLLRGPDAGALAARAGIPLLGRVPFDAELAAAADRGEPYVAVAAESEASRALRDVAAAVRRAVESARR
jgi:ATP-binding protein involved in chromosome partitioning